jgi:hypothetical protein
MLITGRVTLLVDNLYAEATEAIKSHTFSPVSTLKLISILDYVKSEERL